MRQRLMNLQLKTKLLLLFVFVIIIMFLAEYYTRHASYTAYNQLTYENSAQLIDTYLNSIQLELDLVENLTFSILGNSLVQEKLQIINRETPGTTKWIMTKKELEYLLESYSIQNKTIEKFLLVTEPVKFAIKGIWPDRDRALIDEAVSMASVANGQLVRLAREEQLILARSIRRISLLDLSDLGFMLIQVDLPAVMDQVSMNFNRTDIRWSFALLDEDACLYSDFDVPEGAYADKHGYWIEDDFFYTVSESRALGLTLIARTSNAQIQKNLQTIYSRSWFVMLLAITASLLIGNLLSGIISRELTLLLEKIHAFGQGLLPGAAEDEVYRNRQDEVGRLHRHFSRMAIANTALAEEQYNSMLLLKEAQLSQLQKQIQPHFLYNTLSTISWTAYANGDEQTAHLAEALGRMMRTVTNRDETPTTVEKDMQLVRDYLSIQQLRYTDRLIVDVDLSQAALRMHVPQLTLQPIVENAIAHALEEQLEACVIRIYDYQVQDGIVLVVEDNGPGFDENILEQLATGEHIAKGTGIGLSNIDQRLRIAYGPECGLRFERIESGMQVKIYLPYETGDEA